MEKAGRKNNKNGWVGWGVEACLATMLTSLTTAGPRMYTHTQTCTHTYAHTHTERPNQYVTKEGESTVERVGRSCRGGRKEEWKGNYK